MLLTRVLLVGLVLAVSRPAAAWNPFKAAGRAVGDALESGGRSVGKGLGEGAVSALQPALVTTIDTAARAASTLVADVDTRLGRQVDHVGGVASQLISQTQGVVDTSLDKVDHILEKRLLQVESMGTGLVKKLDEAVDRNLHTADAILKERSAQLGRIVADSLGQADHILEARITQLDEAVALRLGNVDVIASKQRIGLEETLVRTAVLLGLLAFVVFVLRTLWNQLATVQKRLGERRGIDRVWGYAAWLLRPALLQIAAAAAAVLVIYALYDRLPLGARKQAAELAAMHRREMAASLARFDFSRTRFHASQLEILLPEQGAYFQAMAGKAELLRDLVMRPALLATRENVSRVVERVQALERQLGDRADPDVLTLKALVLWQVGDSKRDEHTAASYCARALRLSPGGFALAPLARHYIRAFLRAPYLAPDTPYGRDAESLQDLRLLAAAPVVRDAGFPLAPMLALDRLMARLDRELVPAYLEMLEAHAQVVRLAPPRRSGRGSRGEAGGPPALVEARKQRSQAAQRVLSAWRTFDQGIDDIPGLAGQSAILAIFRLNDATRTRAAWFVERPQSQELAPLLAEIADLDLKQRLAPPRIDWERRYGALIAPELHAVAELEEANRFTELEKLTRDFELAYVAQRAADAGPEQSAQRRKAALFAAQLGLYVNEPTNRARVSVAATLAATTSTMDDSDKQALAEAMQARGMRTL
jgi:hypothetical protein